MYVTSGSTDPLRSWTVPIFASLTETNATGVGANATVVGANATGVFWLELVNKGKYSCIVKIVSIEI